MFYDGEIKGMVQDQGSTLLSRKPFSTSAGEGVAVTYRLAATQDSKAMIVFSRTFVAKRSSYTLTFLQADGDTTSGVARRRFFNSITVKP